MPQYSGFDPFREGHDLYDPFEEEERRFDRLWRDYEDELAFARMRFDDYDLDDRFAIYDDLDHEFFEEVDESHELLAEPFMHLQDEARVINRIDRAYDYARPRSKPATLRTHRDGSSLRHSGNAGKAVLNRWSRSWKVAFWVPPGYNPSVLSA